jgi:enolase-phosphatase E1
MTAATAVVTDLEGTTSRIAFVRDTLFPAARRGLPALLRDRAGDPEVAAHLAEVTRLAPGEDPLAALLRWMDADAKVTPLKALQGLVWAQAYADGTISGDVYPDVAPALRRWAGAGLRLHVYSSGSVAAQILLLRHSVAGDLTPLFAGFFDTRVGGKREAASYQAIAAAIGRPAGEVLFLSDVAAELDAAAASGWQTCQVVRAEDGTEACDRHRIARSFDEIALA